MKSRYEMQRCEKRSFSTDPFNDSSLLHYWIVRYRLASKSPGTPAGQKSPGRKRTKSRAELEKSAWREVDDVCAFSLHTVYCNIYVRHCNKNANSFVIRCFSSPAQLPLHARAQANELLIRPGSILPSDEIES